MVLLMAILLSVTAEKKWMATGSGNQGTGPVIWLGESIISGIEKGVLSVLFDFLFLKNLFYIFEFVNR